MFAEKAPLSEERLKRQAEAIVVGTITDLRVESEPSRFEPGLGNFDWGIYLGLRIEEVEKGSLSQDQIQARCFRIRWRKSVAGLFTPSGHHPIPGTGTRVRAYLERREGPWRVVLPNGITSVDDVHDVPGKNLQDAREVNQLKSWVFTYFLPLELWIVMIFVGLAITLGARLLVRRFRKRHRE